MKMSLGNLRIRNKLLLGFTSCIILLLLLGLVAIWSVNLIDAKHTILLNGVVTGARKCEETGKEFAKARRSLLLAAYIGDDSKAVQDALADFDASIVKIKELMEWQLSAIQNDPLFSFDSKAQEAVEATNALIKMVTVDYAGIRNEVEAEIKRGVAEGNVDFMLIREMVITQGTPIANVVTEAIDGIIAETNIALNDQLALTKNEIHKSILLITGLVIVAVIVAILSALIVAARIRRPIEALRQATDKIAKGDFNVQVRSNGKDEIAELSNMMGDIVDVFSLTVDEINKSYMKLVNGKMDVSIDPNIFQGDYKKAVSAVNNMTDDFHKIMAALIQCVAAYAKGDFEATVIRFPGEQAFVNDVFDALQNNLKLINSEIGVLIDNAVAGSLEHRIDETHYQGGWHTIASGLNRLMQAVETPIAEVAEVLNQVANANFDVSINGSYKGQFEDMKVSVNKTVRNTAEYIDDISSILIKMSEQDLNIDIQKDYIGNFRVIKEALIKIIMEFNRLIGDFNISATHVAEGAGQISKSSLSLSQGAAEQAAAIEQLNATIDAIGKQTSINAENSETANRLSSDTKENGIESKSKMDEMLKAMSDIENASSNINKIIKAIDDIAFQTNLLALNAAVEAARAGEHGKGFAVVAEEVRNLAARSQTAASETTELIGKTVEFVSNGTKIANSTASSLSSMVDQITEITSLIEGVSIASKAQDASISQIISGIGQISDVTQSNTSFSEETASASEDLLNRAESLKNSVSRFKFKS